MKTTISILLFLSFSIGLFGQNIGFSYDADGNMVSRYEVILHSPAFAEEEDTAMDIAAIDFVDTKITIYPNPTKGQITVEITPLNSEEENFLMLYDISGKLIKSQKIVFQNTELEIIGTPGTYLLNIHLGKDVSKWKIIKQ
ncbi:hypothetical protein AGMMS50262_14790 [Bacteroidia bacterium]|nr:hypothetical protein AGMMS50262_14790 [Bacteroidia bacterium]